MIVLTCVGEMQNKVEPKMDEAADDGAAKLCDTEEAASEERRLIFEEVFH